MWPNSNRCQSVTLVNSWRKSFDVNRNMLFAISPAMNGSSQNDSAVQAQKRPAMLSEKVREVLRLKYSSFHQLWHKRRPGRADLQVSRSGGAAETVSKVFLRDGGSEGKGEPGWPDSTPHGCQGQ